MKVKKNSKMLWLIKSQTTQTPKSLCTFFWLFIISLASIPISYSSFIFNIINRKKRFLPDNIHALYGALFTVFIFVITEAIGKQLKIKHDLVSILLFSPITLLGILIGVGIIISVAVGLYFLIDHLCQKAEKRREERQATLGPEIIIKKEPSVFRQYIRAKKEKVCPMIEYID